MNQMFSHHEPLPPGDPAHEVYKRGRREWDERLGDAIAREHGWKIGFLASVGVLALSVAGNVWQGAQSKTQTVHVVHDNLGSVISVSTTSSGSGEPTEAQFGAALKEWVANVRTVYTDANAIRRGILDAYKLVDEGSPAKAALDNFFLHVRPAFEYARTNTVDVDQEAAIPPPASAGTTTARTWRLEWQETTKDRAGLFVGAERWEANVTFIWQSPRSPSEALDDPDGIHITAFSWARK